MHMLKRFLILQMLVVLAVACYGAEEGTDYREIGRLIWVNTADPNPCELVRWDETRDCVAMGIGGWAWFPAERAGHADEMFPRFVAFAERQGLKVPKQLRGAAPWLTTGELAADTSGRKEQLQKWLAGHLDVQARFLIAQVHAALPAMLRKSRMAQEVRARFEQLALTPQGLYAMADFLSFMGDGATPGRPEFGLLQALEEMRPDARAGSPEAEFAYAAAMVLQKQAQQTPPEKAKKMQPQSRRLKRCRSYSTALSR